MEEKKQKVQRASAVLDNYKKSKNPETSGNFDYCSSSADYDTTSLTKDKYAQESERNVLKLDSPTLKRKTDQFDSLSKKIKNLQDELSEKSERISALEIENEVLRKGNGDGVGVLPRDGDQLLIKDLQKMVDARNTFIQQLSESLQKRSEELQASIMREKELTEEILNLQQHVNALTSQMELKLSEAYSESVEYRAKVELMSSQIQEYSELVQSLRATMENNNKELITKKGELDAKEKKLKEYKSEVSEDVKTLMRQVETLNYDLSKKEKELVESKKEVELLRSQMEEQFGAEIVALKAKLENKYAEDVRKVEILYDGMLLEHIRKSDDQLKVVEETSVLEDQIKALRELYGNEKNKYREELQAVLARSKATENNLTYELEKYKQEADHYKQQVENLENKVAEEVRKIQRECYKELDQYENDMKREQNKYEEEIQKLSKRLQDTAVIEATKEVELESYKSELDKLTLYARSVEEKFNWSRDEYERQKSQLVAQITEFKNNESKLMNELRTSREKLLQYENKVYEFNENLKDQSTNFNEKYQNVVRSFEEQIQNLMNELERTKAYYEAEKSRFTSILNEKENDIRTFEEQIQSLMNELERTKAYYEDEISRFPAILNEKENHVKDLEAKLNYLNNSKPNQTNESNTTAESFPDQDSVQVLVEQINTLKKNLMSAEKYEKSNREFLVKALESLKQVKTVISKISGNDTEENPQNVDATVGNTDKAILVKEIEKTICDIMNITQSVDQSRMASIYTSTPRANDSTDRSSDTSCIRDDPGNDLVRKCELLEAENINLTNKLEMLAAHMKEMEYCFYVASKESLLFDEKCKDLDLKITELETLKLSEFTLKKENHELKERLLHVEESERNVRRQLVELVENNIKLEKTLNKSLVDLQHDVSNNGPNIKLEAVLSDLKAKSEEVVRLRSQLSAVQNALKDNQEKMMQLKAQCDKFIAEHEFMMSEIQTKQKELEDVWRERNELSTENKMLQSKLVSVQGKSSWHLHKIPSSLRCSSSSVIEAEGFATGKEFDTRKTPIADDEFNDYHLKRLQTMHLLTESIAMSSKTNVLGSSSNLSVSSRIDLELQQLDEMFDEPDNSCMPTITEEDEEFSEEVRVFFQQMSRGDQNKEDKEKVDP